MNNLSQFYDVVKDFCESHNMINEFFLLGSKDDLSSREFEYRTFVMIPNRSNISRDLARPIYTLTFDCLVIDKSKNQDSLAAIKSTEENLFVVGQLQDFLIQQDENCYIDEVDVESYMGEDENITTAFFSLTVAFARKNYNVAIDNA
jgi:hypothetical protein